MIDKIKQTIVAAGEILKDQANSLGEAAKEKGFRIIEGWISILPKLEAYGFKTTYFSFAVSINPTLEVEMQGDVKAFPLERVEAILAETRKGGPTNLVFSALKTTILLHDTAKLEVANPLTVQITVRVPPEVRVSFGEPILA